MGDVNEFPTNIALSKTSIPENMSQGVVGTISTIDPDVEDAFSYEILPEGDGTQFQISGNQLLAAAPGLNYEAGATRSVSIRTTDAGGLSFSRTFAIQVTNVNEPSTDIILTGAAVPEHVPLVVVGTLSAVDPEGTWFFTYEILPGGDGALFQIQGDQLRVGAIGLDYEAGATRNVIVRVRDASFMEFYDEVLVVQIANVDEAPTITSLNLSSSSITAGDITTVFGTFSDADFGDTHTVVIDWGLGEAPTTIVNSSLTDAGDNDPTTKGFSASHQFLSVNQYNVSAKVIDGDGSVGGTAQFASAISFGSTSSDNARGGIVTDPAGPGIFNPPIGSSLAFVWKLDTDGNFVWVQSLGYGSLTSGSDIARDADGNLYVTGTLNRLNPPRSADFDPGVGAFIMTAQGGSDAFLCKLDSAGKFVWARQLGSADSSNAETGSGIAVDQFGNIFTTGIFLLTADFDPGLARYV